MRQGFGTSGGPTCSRTDGSVDTPLTSHPGVGVREGSGPGAVLRGTRVGGLSSGPPDPRRGVRRVGSKDQFPQGKTGRSVSRRVETSGSWDASTGRRRPSEPRGLVHGTPDPAWLWCRRYVANSNGNSRNYHYPARRN